MFNRGAKDTQWRKNSFFNQWYWEKWITTYRINKLEFYLTPLTKINSKWTKNLNIRPDTIKLPRKNTEKKFLDISVADSVLGMTPTI